MNNYNLILGKSKEELKKINNNSIDLILTDPPYGLNFMNKDWDKTLPGTDLYWRMCQMIEEIGFKVNFTPIILLKINKN